MVRRAGEYKGWRRLKVLIGVAFNSVSEFMIQYIWEGSGLALAGVLTLR